MDPAVAQASGSPVTESPVVSSMFEIRVVRGRSEVTAAAHSSDLSARFLVSSSIRHGLQRVVALHRAPRSDVGKVAAVSLGFSAKPPSPSVVAGGHDERHAFHAATALVEVDQVLRGLVGGDSAMDQVCRVERAVDRR